MAVPVKPMGPISRSSHGGGNGCEVTVKLTALLSFMVGATETAKYPEFAPGGIVMLIVVLFQLFTRTGASLSMTKLPLCVFPNPVPVIVTWLPTGPVVAETEVMTGAGAVAEAMETLSKVAVAAAEVLWFVTAIPMYTFCAMLIV